jgi:hypothetical protein
VPTPHSIPMCLDDSPFALVVDANGTGVRITSVTDLRTRPFTIAGWEVAGIDSTVEGLAGRGGVLQSVRRHGSKSQWRMGLAQWRSGRAVP